MISNLNSYQTEWFLYIEPWSGLLTHVGGVTLSPMTETHAQWHKHAVLLLNSFIEKKTKKIIYNIMKPISTEIVVPQYYEKTI